MNRKLSLRGKKAAVSLQISLLILSIFAFAFLIFENSGVEGQAEIIYATMAVTVAISQGLSSGVLGLTNGGNPGVWKSLGWENWKNIEGGSEHFGGFYHPAKYGVGDALAGGLTWAFYAYLAGKLIGGIFGLSGENTNALSYSLAAGFGTFKFLSTWHGPFGSANGAQAGWWGLGVGIAVFILTYKDQKQKTVVFSCLPWQAPTGGENCELCNDPDFPCSEYRCKSLGQTCELVNKGTDQEACVNINPHDVSPPVIEPDYDVLTSGHEYTNVRNSPPGPGFNIINLESDDGCLQAFTPLKFGVITQEPAQCKIDFEHTATFDEMKSYIGGSNLFDYEHSEQFTLPGAKVLENSSFALENGKDVTFFIRCMDKNGNENSAEYAVNFCIDPSPDTTPPRIEATSIQNGGCVAENQDEANVEFYTNEPSDCRWSIDDQSYDSMPSENQMQCSNELYQINANQLFTCKTVLKGIARDQTQFYIRCRDQPKVAIEDRNTMTESFKFTLRGSDGLRITQVKPNETIFGGVSPAPIELFVQTKFGCDNGKAVCFYSLTGEQGDFIQFFDTNNDDGIHTQKQSLEAGDHKYFIKCVDGGGNVAEETIEFKLEIDENAPVIARIYEESQKLKVVTVRPSECSYTLNTCDFSFEEGTQMPIANSTVHFAEWNKENTYYIKCRDEFRNEDADCSAIAKPSQFFL